MRIFISHSSKDAETATTVCDLLEQQSYACFLAPRNIRSGYEYAEEIVNGIDSSDIMLLLLSRASNASPHVLREVERAVSKKIPIIVYRLEEVELTKSMEYFLMTHQWILPDAKKGHAVILESISEFARKATLGADSGNSQDTPESNGKKRRVPAGICLGMIVLAAVLLIGAIVYLGKSRPSDPDSLENQSTEAANEVTVAIQPGDRITFGTYLGQPITWRVLTLYENGQQALVVAADILTFKAYDAAESGQFNYYEGEFYGMAQRDTLSTKLQRQIRGDNCWRDSNIRTWLNSENENVKYSDQAPNSKAMADLTNGYDTEPGFLNGFSEAERNAILTTKVETNGVTTEDKVFLLSKEELSLLEFADVTKYPVPTAEAIAADRSGWYQVYSLDLGVQDYYWWLRDGEASEANACEGYVVGNSYAEGEIFSKSVGLEGFGIRPAMMIDLSCEEIQKQ
ncbi:MAG: TIR domain-containing protein [Acetatifactor sp.]